MNYRIMGDYDPYDESDFTDVELVEMGMGNPVGEKGVKLREIQFQLKKAQAKTISDALSAYNDYEDDIEQEITQRTERFFREQFDLD